MCVFSDTTPVTWMVSSPICCDRYTSVAEANENHLADDKRPPPELELAGAAMVQAPVAALGQDKLLIPCW
jgi:hypothetical protein